MKPIIKSAALALTIMLCASACGNAGNRKENRNTEDKTQNKVTELTSETFSTKVYDINNEESAFLGDKPAIIDFTATWCGPCQRIAPILEELAAEYQGVIDIYKVDVDKESGLAQKFNVSSIPAILFVPADGEPVMTVGSRNKETFKNQIDQILLGK